MPSSLSPQQLLDLALEHHHAGRLREAESLYRQVLSVSPNHPDVLHMLGLLADQVGRTDVAIDLIRRAVAINPSNAVFHCNLGNVLQSAGQLDQALASFRRAIELQPIFPDALFNLGNALKEKGDLEQAIAAFRQAIAQRPNFPQVYNNLATALNEAGHLEPAIAAAQQAILQQPEFPEAHNNLGNLYLSANRLDESIASIRLALLQRSRFPEANYNLGNALRAAGRFQEALESYRTAIQLQPDFATARFNLGLTMLLLGDFEHGWDFYESRWDAPELQLRRQPFAQPQWDGSPLNGRRLLLYAEQGFGDAIQFSRFAPIVAKQERGGVIFACMPELQELMQSLQGLDPIISLTSSQLPEFDVHCPLMSLPRLLHTRLESIPNVAPYLHAERRRIDHWRRRVADDPCIKIGLAWAGRPTHLNDRNRSIPIALFAELGEVKSMSFYSLQKWTAGAAEKYEEHFRPIDHTADLANFADTAALIENLDLVISIDSAVAHLAGALGKPVWLLLPFAPDWRWMLDRDDSPWYPTMRLFRQQRVGDWDGVIRSLVPALQSLARRPQS